MNEGLLTGTAVTVTFTDGSEGVTVIAPSMLEASSRVNTMLAEGEFLCFQAVDTEKIRWIAIDQVAAIDISPVTLADAATTSDAKQPTEDS